MFILNSKSYIGNFLVLTDLPCWPINSHCSWNNTIKKEKSTCMSQCPFNSWVIDTRTSCLYRIILLLGGNMDGCFNCWKLRLQMPRKLGCKRKTPQFLMSVFVFTRSVLLDQTGLHNIKIYINISMKKNNSIN